MPSPTQRTLAARQRTATVVRTEVPSTGPGTFIVIDLPIRTVSELNQREHWTRRYKRKCAQQNVAAMMLRAELWNLKGSRMLHEMDRPLRITLTRIGPRKLDNDNAVASLKHIRDSLARVLNINDGDEMAAVWDYGPQQAGKYAVRVRIEGAWA